MQCRNMNRPYCGILFPLSGIAAAASHEFIRRIFSNSLHTKGAFGCRVELDPCSTRHSPLYGDLLPQQDDVNADMTKAPSCQVTQRCASCAFRFEMAEASRLRQPTFPVFPRNRSFLCVTLCGNHSVRPISFLEAMQTSDKECGMRHMPRNAMIRFCCNRPCHSHRWCEKPLWTGI